MELLKKSRLQKKFHDVAQILQQVDMAVMSVRQKLFELENWKTNLVNKLHACQIELMGLDANHNCELVDDQRVTFPCQTTSTLVNGIEDKDGSTKTTTEQNDSVVPITSSSPTIPIKTRTGTTRHKHHNGPITICKRTNGNQVELLSTIEDDDDPKTDDDDDDDDESQEKEEEESNDQIFQKTSTEKAEKVLLEPKMDQVKQANSLEICTTDMEVEDANKNDKTTAACIIVASKDSDTVIESNSISSGEKSKTSSHISVHSTIMDNELSLNNENNLLKRPLICTSPTKSYSKSNSSSSNSSSQKIRKKSISSSASSSSGGDLASSSSTTTTNLPSGKDVNSDKKLGMNVSVSISRINLPPNCYTFIVEPRSNSWTPVKRTRRVPKPIQHHQQKQTVQEPSKSGGGRKTRERKKIPPVRQLKRNRGQSKEEKVKVVGKQNEKNTTTTTTKRGRGKSKTKNNNTEVPKKSQVSKDEGVKKKAKLETPQQQRKKMLNKQQPSTYNNNKRNKKSQIIDHSSYSPSSSQDIIHIDLVDDDDEDYEEEEDITQSSSPPQMIAAAMTINHNPLNISMPTLDDHYPAGQELWANLSQDLTQVIGENGTNTSVMCEQCGQKSETMSELKLHQLYGKCNSPEMQLNDLLEFADVPSTPSTLVDNPFDELRYDNLRSGDEIPFLNEEEVVQEDDSTEEKVIVRSFDPNFVMWDGIVSDSFSEVDLVESLTNATNTVNGLHHHPTGNDFYGSPKLVLAPGNNPYPQNN